MARRFFPIENIVFTRCESLSKKLKIVVLGVVVIFAFSIAPRLYAQNAAFMSINDLRPGMKGYGKTVFQGTKIEQFDVEILGVLKNIAPKQDMILSRLSGGPLEHTGVIAGMSGSPVFVDGKLIGAVAFAFPFAKDPIAGIQPIQQMMDLLDLRPGTQPSIARASGTLPTTSPAAFVMDQFQKLAEGRPLHEVLLPQSMIANSVPSMGTAGSAQTFAKIQTPLFISGASTASLQQFAPVFSAFGFMPVQGGGSGSAAGLTGASTKLEPGSSVNVELIRGDLSWSANGTVTWVDGNKVYAFGHPNLAAGPTDVPMSAGYVISLLPNIQNSFKMAVPLEVVGAFRQDRSTGIGGLIGERSKMIPVNVKLTTATNTTNQYTFEVADDRFLTPALMNFVVFNSITASERSLGELTLSVNGQIHLKDHDTINIGNVFSADNNGALMASNAAVSPVQYLLTSGYDGVVIQKVDLEIKSVDRKTTAALDSISVDKSEVKPGDTVTMTAFLREANGATVVERYPIQIPTGLPAGPVQLLVGDGSTVTSGELRRGPSSVPNGLQQVINELNKLRKNDRLYVKILNSDPGVMIGGEELPSVPPSLAAVLNTDRSSSRNVSGTRSSTIREYELPQSKYVIQGQRALNLTVKP
jgi:SpoIVB peptidase S55